ncbi:efflux transporter outer membrane subunit [Acinetobacter indicus]|uniref:efflux transporter outer membrane subunit n=1 Tax=Acinetobacter indicus TaxID=756892 RepID=UPI001266790D|nr:efflux transporter outer membrane subunit [Acinetobacter indicus]QFS17346.1 efflux transporter outer membrane subunit [Acinetobacter indicus]
MNISSQTKFGCLMILFPLLHGCIASGSYQAPAAKVSAQWNSSPDPTSNSVELTQFWQSFHDIALTQLIRTTLENNQSLVKALANIDAARANLTTQRASLYPTLSGNGSVSRVKDASGQSNQNSIGLDASWEIDLWRKYRNQSDAAAARLQARTADMHSMQISLAAEMADYYTQYLACRSIQRVYSTELSSIQKTEKATALLVKAGFTAPMDHALIVANLENTRSNSINQNKQCEILIKSMTALASIDESELRQILAQSSLKFPLQHGSFVISEVPADVMRSRPDIAALEREVFASYAEIKSAEADRYPNLSLSGVINAASSGGASLNTWSIGANLLQPIFDAGKRKATVQSNIAKYNAAVADYQSGVINAAAEIEKQLVTIQALKNQEKSAQSSYVQYQKYFNALEISQKAGSANLLDLEAARRSALNAQISVVNIQQQYTQSWISLYKALGGTFTPKTSVHIAQNGEIQ